PSKPPSPSADSPWVQLARGEELPGWCRDENRKCMPPRRSQPPEPRRGSPDGAATHANETRSMTSRSFPDLHATKHPCYRFSRGEVEAVLGFDTAKIPRQERW